MNTLNRYRNRRPQRDETAGGTRWVAVEVSRSDRRKTNLGGSGLAVVGTSGWRIEVGREFDAGTLAQLMHVLERV